jgi:hypothetical protein
MGIVSRLEEAAVLDRAIEPVQRVARWLRPGRTRDVLHGVSLGHPVHPMLVQSALGAWMSAGVLDLWPGDGREVRRLGVFGLVASAPAALTGTVDWSEQHEHSLSSPACWGSSSSAEAESASRHRFTHGLNTDGHARRASRRRDHSDRSSLESPALLGGAL